MLSCGLLEDGSNRVIDDLSVDCGSSDYSILRVISITWLAVFGFLFPIALGIRLFINRRSLLGKAGYQAMNSDFGAVAGFMFCNYRRPL